ncbi:MAG: hypothetical protein Q9169_007940, partial [Polycauliona sp. 2 TL-2023]
MASTVLTVPASPSIFDRDPRSPNSWTGRSFTTLLPSDSPSQALFPKYSQASRLLAARTDNTRNVQPQVIQPLRIQQSRPSSFAKRNLYFILPAALLHISMIVLTALLVLIITAATANPPRRINPSYYFGIMFSIAASVASIIVIWIKHTERQRSRHVQALHSPTSPTQDNDIELGRLPAPLTTVRGAADSGWEDQDLRSPGVLNSFMMISRIPFTTASARVAGSSNHLRTLNEDVNVAPGTMPNAPQHQQQDSTSTAAALQRLLENELQRQEKIKRRISEWLMGVPSPPPSSPPSPLPIEPHQASAPTYPPPPPPISPQPTQQKRPIDPVRLAELDREIESYLGFPAPTLFAAEAAEKERHDGKGDAETVEVKDEEEEEIDFDTLPPAVPRLGAKSRKLMLSDPITVLHVGPMRQKGSPFVREVDDSDGYAETPPPATADTTATTAAPTLDANRLADRPIALPQF